MGSVQPQIWKLSRLLSHSGGSGSQRQRGRELQSHSVRPAIGAPSRDGAASHLSTSRSHVTESNVESRTASSTRTPQRHPHRRIARRVTAEFNWGNAAAPTTEWNASLNHSTRTSTTSLGRHQLQPHTTIQSPNTRNATRATMDPQDDDSGRVTALFPDPPQFWRAFTPDNLSRFETLKQEYADRHGVSRDTVIRVPVLPEDLLYLQPPPEPEDQKWRLFSEPLSVRHPHPPNTMHPPH